MKRALSLAACLVLVAAVWIGVAHGHAKSKDTGSPAWVNHLTATAQATHPSTPAEGTSPSVNPANTSKGSTISTNQPAKTTESPSAAKQTTGAASESHKTSTTVNKGTTKQTSSGGTSSVSSSSSTGSTHASGSSGTGNQAGTTPPQKPNLGTFTVIVSENNGQNPWTKQISITQGESLIQYMHQNYVIQTVYNDEFMISIQTPYGTFKSQWTDVPPADRQPVDWLLYVDGQEPPVGAADIDPKAGDTVVWDYHRWDPSTGKG